MDLAQCNWRAWVLAAVVIFELLLALITRMRPVLRGRIGTENPNRTAIAIPYDPHKNIIFALSGGDASNS
jgi:hypothetical protein